MKKILVAFMLTFFIALVFNFSSVLSQTLISLQSIAGTNADTQLLFNNAGTLGGYPGAGLDSSSSPTTLTLPWTVVPTTLQPLNPLTAAYGGLGFDATTCLTGQIPVGVNGANLVCGSPGTGQRTISGTSDAIHCDGATAIGDENSTMLYTNASGGTVAVPQQNSSGCLNMSFVTVIAPGAGSWVFTPTTSTITWVKDGTSGATGASSITLTQYEVAIWAPAASNNYLVRIQ